MAFPAPGTQVDTDFATSVTSMPVNMPATVDSGDILIALVSVRTAGTWTKPSNWNDIATLSQAGGGSVGKTNGFYKTADGTEGGGTATWTASTGTSGAWQVIRVTGWHGTTPPEATTASGDATAANPPSLTPSWGSADTLWIAVAGHAASSAAAFTAAPTNYTNFANNGASSGGAAVSIASGYRQSAAASEDPGTFTAGGSNRFWASATIAVRPAAGGGAQDIPATGIASTAAIGSPTASPGAVDISPTGISSASALGSPTLSPGEVTIAATGISSTSAVGSPTVTGGAASIAPTGISSTESLGTVTLSPGSVDISPSSITSSLTIGSPTVSGSSTGKVKVYAGSFTAKPVKVWNGSSWVVKPAKVWNGSSWAVTNY